MTPDDTLQRLRWQYLAELKAKQLELSALVEKLKLLEQVDAEAKAEPEATP